MWPCRPIYHRPVRMRGFGWAGAAGPSRSGVVFSEYVPAAAAAASFPANQTARIPPQFLTLAVLAPATTASPPFVVRASVMRPSRPSPSQLPPPRPPPHLATMTFVNSDGSGGCQAQASTGTPGCSCWQASTTSGCSCQHDGMARLNSNCVILSCLG